VYVVEANTSPHWSIQSTPLELEEEVEASLNPVEARAG
jgi:hypothetical protein